MIKNNRFVALMIFIIFCLFIAALTVSFFSTPEWSIRWYYFAGFISFLLIGAAVSANTSVEFSRKMTIFTGGLGIIMILLYFAHFLNIFNHTFQVIFNWPILVSGIILCLIFVFEAFVKGFRDTSVIT